MSHFVINGCYEFITAIIEYNDIIVLSYVPNTYQIRLNAKFIIYDWCRSFEESTSQTSYS